MATDRYSRQSILPEIGTAGPARLRDSGFLVGKPLISASVHGWSGYVVAFCGGAPSYRAVFPEMPRQAGSCATAGVLGSAVGVMGTLQANMVLSWLLRLEPAVLGQLVTV